MKSLLPCPNEFRCRRFESLVPVSARQERVSGWDQQALSGATYVLGGAGGLGAQVAYGLVRKGAKKLVIADKDIVATTNLNRQMFFAADLFKNKAQRLCRNLRPHGHFGTELVAEPCWLHELDLAAIKPDVVIVAVDNQLPSARLDACRICAAFGIPAVFLGVTPDADGGYVFVQERNSADWACALKPQHGKGALGKHPATCPEAAASIDILATLAGIALYAADTLLMRRPRDWNYWYVSLSRGGFGGAMNVARRPGCIVCGDDQMPPRGMP